ncbi:MAG: CBS domain-containing protein [Leptolyngbyaceae cyanobacterium HOT.MB2.61]|nr:CBS domain-containing protein [Leptolyngbyaceae cyanobacterium HOT.MB2.61]
MDLILCHTTADFDTLGAAVGLTRLRPGARIVLSGGAHPAVRDFLALHRDEYALIERRSVNPEKIRSIFVVDTQRRDRLGKTAEWLDLPDVEIAIYDHHLDTESDIPASRRQIEAIGSTTTLIVEQLQAQEIVPNPIEATVMALGIHVDTGSLTFDHTTARDARALAWLMEQGANLRAIADYIDPGLSPRLQDLLTVALETLETETVQGHTLAWVLLQVDEFVPGLSSLASRLMDLTEIDALLLAARYCRGATCHDGTDAADYALTVIGRSQIQATDLNELFKPLGGGGHPRAASINLHNVNPPQVLAQLVEQLKAQIPHPPTARELMSSPVRTIRPETTIDEAQRILLRYGHSGLSVVDAAGQLVGVISRRDLDIALHHGFSHAPVKGYMTTNLKTITPETPLPEIESIMVTYDVGRLPVLDEGHLVGIVTRTDVLRQLHQAAFGSQEGKGARGQGPGVRSQEDTGLEGCQPKSFRLVLSPQGLLKTLQKYLKTELWDVLTVAARHAEQRGWHLYLVGGAVRDFLLGMMASDPEENQMLMVDVDLVVDGFHRAADAGAGVELARSLQTLYPETRLEIHGKFQTAALLWHNDPSLDSLWVDIATARTEFYPYPAANPEVEASSIRQDLYRRDFTINALAIRLTNPHAGEILDFFGGLLDLQAKQIRVLHPNSFIEDPTRIYRAVRFAVRLGFEIDAQTQGYIRHAIASGIYQQIQNRRDGKPAPSDAPRDRVSAPALQTRLKAELKYILQAPYWKSALQQLADLEALQCIHPTLKMTPDLWKQLRRVERWLRRMEWQAEGVRDWGAGNRKKESGKKEKKRRQDLEGGDEWGGGNSELKTQNSKLLTPLPFPTWLLLLEVLLSHLAPEHRATVAENLQLPADSIERMQQLETAQKAIAESLLGCDRPSQIVQQLKPYDSHLLVLIAIRCERQIRRTIWQYLTHWSNIKPPLNGNDLKALGYKPGPRFREILDTLTAATLDGTLRTRSEAEAFLRENFPR